MLNNQVRSEEDCLNEIADIIRGGSPDEVDQVLSDIADEVGSSKLADLLARSHQRDPKKRSSDPERQAKKISGIPGRTADQQLLHRRRKDREEHSSGNISNEELLQREAKSSAIEDILKLFKSS